MNQIWVDFNYDLIGRDATAMFESYHPNYVAAKLPQFHIGDLEKWNPYYSWNESKFYPTLKKYVLEWNDEIIFGQSNHKHSNSISNSNRSPIYKINTTITPSEIFTITYKNY